MAATTMVSIGESGANVSAVQRWLRAAYPAASGLAVSGTYDEPTAALVRQWKAEHPGYGGDPLLNQFVIPSDAIASFGAQAPAAGTTTAADANTPARAQLKALLDQWSLGTLTDWAWGQLTSGANQDQVLLSIKDQGAYKERFGNTNAARVAQGLQPLSESYILSYEQQAASAMRAAGLPRGFYDQPADFAKFLSNDVSVSELNQRVQWAKQLVVEDPSVLPEETQAFQRLYGVGQGDLAAYLLDPERAAPLIGKQVSAAQDAAQARLAGFGDLSTAQAERVSGLTSSTQQAAQGFQQLAHMRELMSALPGEAGADTIGTDTQIAAQFAGDQGAQDTISRRQRARQAAFQATQGNYQRGLGTSTTSSL